MANLADRINELRQIATDTGVADQVGDLPGNPEMLASAYAFVLGLDQYLVLDPTIPLDDIAEFSKGGTA